MSISHAIALVVLCIATAVAKKTDFQASTAEFMKVINIHVSDLHGVVGNSFTELAESSDAQGLLKRTIHPQAPEMHLTDVATALKGKVMPHIPERSQMSLNLHLTSDDRAVALSFANSLYKVALPNIKIPPAAMASINKALSHVNGLKVAKPLKMPLAAEMLLEADMKEIEAELEADSAMVARGAHAIDNSLERRGGLLLLLGPIPLVVVGSILIIAGIITLIAKASGGEDLKAGWIVLGVGVGCAVAGAGLGYAMMKMLGVTKE